MLGYYRDDFIRHLVSTSSTQNWRKDPLMNRGAFLSRLWPKYFQINGAIVRWDGEWATRLGYYSRVAAVSKLLRQFITAAGAERAQVVSLGAGFDTNFWRLAVRCFCASSTAVLLRCTCIGQ
jgi:hypothetical protein